MKNPSTIEFEAEYQAVFLQGGQVFFGKLEGLGNDFPVLRGVYQVQQQMNPETKQVANVLIKRAAEPHMPDLMILNAQHIVFVEPVGAESGVARFLSSPTSAEGK